mgnify:FL=1
MSALKARIADEMKAALLGRHRFRGDVLRNLKAAILNEEVSLGKRDEGLNDAEVEKVLAREVKKRVESAELYRSNGRIGLAESEEKEAAILREFLPEQLSEAEVVTIVEDVIVNMSDVSMQKMGQVIGAVKQKVGNAADGALVAKIVKEKLTK